MDKYEMYDIAFKNLSFDSKLSKIKKHMLGNPYLLLGINTYPYLAKKYHEYVSGESFKLELELLS